MGFSELTQLADTQGITPEEKFVLLALANHAGSYFAQPFAEISLGYIEQLTCIPQARIEETLSQLQAQGHIEIRKHPEFPDVPVAYLLHCNVPSYLADDLPSEGL